MNLQTFYTTKQDIGRRIDVYLVEQFTQSGIEVSRTALQRLIQNKMVLVNGKKVHSSFKFKTISRVEANFKEDELRPKICSIQPENIPLDIIYEDDAIIVLNKPAGIVVHPAYGNPKGTLVNALLYHYKDLPGKEKIRAGLVHRLDKETSGVIIVAKTEESLNKLTRQFKNRVVRKKYIAIVEGEIKMDDGIINLPIGRNLTERKKMSVRYVGAKEAVSAYHVLKRLELKSERYGKRKVTVVEIMPKTGRTHQIRVHLSHIGHPIIGDKTYMFKNNSYDWSDIKRHLLHAESLSFTHPKTEKYVKFSAPIPDDMNKIIFCRND